MDSIRNTWWIFMDFRMPIATIAVTSSLLEKGGVCPGIMKISGPYAPWPQAACVRSRAAEPPSVSWIWECLG